MMAICTSTCPCLDGEIQVVEEGKKEEEKPAEDKTEEKTKSPSRKKVSIK